MASEDKETPLPTAFGSSRHLSPPPGLRQRPLGRAATFAEPSIPLNRRRSSIFSESFSEARKSLRSSTDDLLLPRVNPAQEHQDADESSPWHSLPLGLALLPAIGGLFFKDGSAVITDITLLALAAIFMNWALRTPWQWYHGAQTISPQDVASPTASNSIEEENEAEMTGSKSSSEAPRLTTVRERSKIDTTDEATMNARRELRVHELLAFASCFIFPVLAAWLLHAIRSQLSRPSEGLVSTYNLTIFLLVAEIRPLSHLIKMIQRRTLFLQRTINLETLKDHSKMDQIKHDDLLIRLEELEAHVANGIASTDVPKEIETSEAVVAKASSQASSELRRLFQPELDALNRAMRRYEKRSTVSAVQHEARMQELETRVKDVVVLAAAAHRYVDQQPRNYILILTNWVAAMIVVPAGYLKVVLSLPQRLLSQALLLPKRYFALLTSSKRVKEGKSTRKGTKPQSQDRDKKTRAGG